jgi:hypothetical protein
MLIVHHHVLLPASHGLPLHVPYKYLAVRIIAIVPPLNHYKTDGEGRFDCLRYVS